MYLINVINKGKERWAHQIIDHAVSANSKNKVDHRKPIPKIHDKRVAKQAKFLDFTDRNGETALISAIYMNMEDIALKLIKHGADINLGPNSQDYISRPLQVACATKMLSVAIRLMECDVDLNIQDHLGWTALMFCCWGIDVKTNEKIALAIMETDKANVNLQSNEGDTALIMACENKMETIAVNLINYGADLFIKNSDGKTAVDFIYEKNLQQVIERLKIINSRLILGLINSDGIIGDSFRDPIAELHVVGIIVDLLY